jgi:hypothetical protein
LLLAQYCQAQKLDKATLDKSLSLKNDAVYVVNGIAYLQSDSLQLNAVLAAYAKMPISELKKLDDEAKLLIGATRDVVLIQFADRQSKKAMKRAAKASRKKPD